MPGNLLLPTEPIQLPLLPLRDVVVFPHMVMPLFVGRPKSIKALEASMETGKSILLVAQKTASKDEPTVQDLYQVGCIANILQMLKLPDGTVKVLVEGTQRADVSQIEDSLGYFNCEATPQSIPSIDQSETEALKRAIVAQFDQYVKLNKKIPQEILASLTGIDDASRLADTICAHLPIKLDQKQLLLEMNDVVKRLESLLGQLESEIDILQVEKRIRGRVKRQMEKSQREYYLNEQVKAIQKELGEGEEGADLEELEKKIKLAKMPKEALKKAESELKKLKLMSPMSAEATVVRNYIDTLINLPWKKKSKVNNDLNHAESVLNDDHYGLDKVKERILEYLAVQQRVEKVKAPILCLVGPPGVGKTSLGQSIARATNRKFVRMALGGVRDESEIRGHRRTYIGSMPGKILTSLTKVGVRNPLFLLDEIDKMGMDFRGDPASAMLEVLDPEQNHTFQDHYEVDFDLSDVMFVATSNSLNIPGPLLDRMEVIRLAGYTEDEKTHIAIRYLLPKQIKNNGLKNGEIEVKERSRIKQISGANLARNWVMIPHVTQFDEADITSLEDFRKQLNEEYKKAEIKITPLAFLIKACVFALKKFPEFNSSIDGNNLVYKKYYNIGFAADTPNGLVVPVLKDADKKGVIDLANESSALAKLAREGKLKPTDMQGGTFTISSLGGIGGTAFTPIVNAPEVAILGISKSSIKPIWNGIEFTPRLMLPLSLSYDHRIIDGALAAKFTTYLATVIADIRRLSL